MWLRVDRGRGLLRGVGTSKGHLRKHDTGAKRSFGTQFVHGLDTALPAEATEPQPYRRAADHGDRVLPPTVDAHTGEACAKFGTLGGLLSSRCPPAVFPGLPSSRLAPAFRGVDHFGVSTSRQLWWCPPMSPCRCSGGRFGTDLLHWLERGPATQRGSVCHCDCRSPTLVVGRRPRDGCANEKVGKRSRSQSVMSICGVQTKKLTKKNGV